MPHYRVRQGFYVHRNNSVLTPGAIIEAEPDEIRKYAHQLEEVEIEPKASRSRKPSTPKPEE